jgi:hypothetical protein
VYAKGSDGCLLGRGGDVKGNSSAKFSVNWLGDMALVKEYGIYRRIEKVP